MNAKRSVPLTVILLLLVIFLAYQVWPTSHRDKNYVSDHQRRAQDSSWTLLYETEDVGGSLQQWAAHPNRPRTAKIFTCQNGKTSLLAKSPEPYDSLGTWIGYSNKLRSVIVSRFNESHFHILKLDLGKRRVSTGSLLPIGMSTDNAKAFSVHGGRLWTIKGTGHRADLCSCNPDGTWERLVSWQLPASSRVTKYWLTAPAVGGRNVAFASPSEDLMVAGMAGGPVRTLMNGPRNWQNQGSESSRPLSAIAISPSGDKIAYSPPDQLLSKSGAFYLVDTGSGRARTLALNDTRDAESLRYEPLSSPVKMIWIPATNLVACELVPGESGHGVIVTVDCTDGRSVLLPVETSPDQWCIMPGSPGS